MDFGDGSEIQTYSANKFYSNQIIKSYSSTGSYSIVLTCSYKDQQTTYIMNGKKNSQI